VQEGVEEIVTAARSHQVPHKVLIRRDDVDKNGWWVVEIGVPCDGLALMLAHEAVEDQSKRWWLGRS
jgi:hypothetical protein